MKGDNKISPHPGPAWEVSMLGPAGPIHAHATHLGHQPAISPVTSPVPSRQRRLYRTYPLVSQSRGRKCARFFLSDCIFRFSRGAGDLTESPIKIIFIPCNFCLSMTLDVPPAASKCSGKAIFCVHNMLEPDKVSPLNARGNNIFRYITV